MKKIILAAATILCFGSSKLMAQEASPVKKVDNETREVKSAPKAQMGQVKSDQVRKDKNLKEVKMNEGKHEGQMKPHHNEGKPDGEMKEHRGDGKEHHEGNGHGHHEGGEHHEGHDHDWKDHKGNPDMKEKHEEIKKVKDNE